ncbi:MAG: phage tail sheath C-terminal domain-containing protein [Marmoricola sp.]
MTATTLTFRGRLPGVDCDPALPVGDQPVRLDVAGFVGFAEKGPLNVPVPVEDLLQYDSIFGGDLALAQEGGVPVYAQLPRAVRSFFDNGGRRCYVVRVAGRAVRTGRWQVPGLQVWMPDTPTSTAPVVVESAWPGSWSVGTSVQTVLLEQQLKLAGNYVRGQIDVPGQLPLQRGSTVGLQSGDVLRLNFGGTRPLVFARVRSIDAAASVVLVESEYRYKLDAAGVETPAPTSILAISLPVVSAELLRFDLVIRQRTSTNALTLDRLGDLAFSPPVVPGSVPRPAWTDVLQLARPEPPDPLDPTRGQQPDLTRSLRLRQDPATAALLATGLALPVTMAVPSAVADVDQDPSTEVGLLQKGDDDLGTFDLSCFVDPALADDTVHSVVGHADQLTSLAKEPIDLVGLHSLLPIDEVALVAVPDASHRGWSAVPDPVRDPVPDPEPPAAVDWSDFRCCDDEPASAAPVALPPVPTRYDGLPQLDRISDYDEGPLRGVQVALVTMCAGRADQVALLSVPKHYDVPMTVAWRAALGSDRRVTDTTSVGSAPLSYATLWHPWVSLAVGQVGTAPVLRDVCPDGIVAGSIAARELSRGAWITPAGVPVRGVVRLAADLTGAEEIALFDAHANLLVHKPGTFSALSAHTLTGDSQLLQVSVRRLLILLRKICLRLGARYAFDVNNDRFRQLVRMRFDRILGNLVDRGALHAFRVVIDGDVNTAEDQDNGRFVVALQVAPTNPVEFITVTLLRSGEGLLDVLEG